MSPGRIVAWMQRRLREQVPDLRHVGGAAGFAEASESNPRVTPAAFVFSTAESADGGGFSADSPAMYRVEIAVVTVVRHVGDPSGADATDDIEALRDQEFAVLLGQRPDAQHTEAQFLSGGVLAVRDRHYWWQDHWTLTTTLAADSVTDSL